MDTIGLVVPAAGAVGKASVAARAGELIEDGTQALGVALNAAGSGGPLKNWVRGLRSAQ